MNTKHNLNNEENLYGPLQLSATAASVRFDNERMYVRLVDGREMSIPFRWFPILSNATPEQRNNWKITHRGRALRWEEIDEDILVRTLLGPCA